MNLPDGEEEGGRHIIFALHRHRCHGKSKGKGGNHKDLRSMKSGGVSDNLCPIRAS